MGNGTASSSNGPLTITNCRNESEPALGGFVSVRARYLDVGKGFLPAAAL
jgi:hypothetical protein